jgi:hypothetical protein
VRFIEPILRVMKLVSDTESTKRRSEHDRLSLSYVLARYRSLARDAALYLTSHLFFSFNNKKQRSDTTKLLIIR